MYFHIIIKNPFSTTAHFVYFVLSFFLHLPSILAQYVHYSRTKPSPIFLAKSLTFDPHSLLSNMSMLTFGGAAYPFHIFCLLRSNIGHCPIMCLLERSGWPHLHGVGSSLKRGSVAVRPAKALNIALA
jgi:hypothetical protein